MTKIYKCQECEKEYDNQSQELSVVFNTGEPSLECSCGGEVKVSVEQDNLNYHNLVYPV